MRIVITGGEGFIGRNLRVHLRESGYREVRSVTRATTAAELADALNDADFVFHLAGVNRPPDEAEFVQGNVGSTETLCSALAATGRRIPVAYASSIQAALDNAYGRSKRAAEDLLLKYGHDSGAPIHLFRLPNIFGKWSRPHYNSVVATFCHQIARGLPIKINDAATTLRLIYIDDVVSAFASQLAPRTHAGDYPEAGPVYETTLGDLARTLQEFADSRSSLMIPRVGAGLRRALYATYISHLPTASFAYEVPCYGDPRGTFVEMLKTPDCGQFSYFTAKPGVTRGQHYHHTKIEQFLVIQGTARFGFRNIDSGETHELLVRGGEGRIVFSVPGWTHDVTNVGDDDLVIMLWASEVFDRSRPDTVASRVAP